MQGKFLVKIYNRFIGWAASTLLITAITSLFLLPENTLLDLRFRFRGPTRADTSLVVITQDESFAHNRNYDLDRTPRDHLAALVDTLSACGVKAIALYYDFSKAEEVDSNFRKLQAAIGRFRFVYQQRPDAAARMAVESWGCRIFLDLPDYEICARPALGQRVFRFPFVGSGG